MSDWWEKPYKGGPMVVPAAYFPRPLYPPDANKKGKKPSVDGPDVIAYKRTLSRAGRWLPWDPAKWDDTFNNQFSHGKSGNVKESGVAGFQRQMGIDDTGWIGKQGFNALASIRIPDGLPHAGEMAMDANAANLIAEAYSIYGGKAEPPPPPPASTVRERALAGAISWLGYVETGNNDTVFGSWYGMNYQPWCAMFVTYCFEIEAGGSPSFVRGSKYSYCPYIFNDAWNDRNGLSITLDPKPGDVVLYDWGRDSVPDHVGIFERGSATDFDAIEGNTSTANNSNGGSVMRRARRSTDALITFVRVKEP